MNKTKTQTNRITVKEQPNGFCEITITTVDPPNTTTNTFYEMKENVGNKIQEEIDKLQI